MTTLIDSNILIDIFGDDPVWYNWSALQVRNAITRGAIVINDVVYSEASIRYASVSLFEEALVGMGVGRAAIPGEALFIAGKVFP